MAEGKGNRLRDHMTISCQPPIDSALVRRCEKRARAIVRGVKREGGIQCPALVINVSPLSRARVIFRPRPALFSACRGGVGRPFPYAGCRSVCRFPWVYGDCLFGPFFRHARSVMSHTSQSSASTTGGQMSGRDVGSLTQLPGLIHKFADI